MRTDSPRHETLAGLPASFDRSHASTSDRSVALERAVDAILDDCFLSLGQAVGLRASFDYEAVMWIRNNFRARFLAAMRNFGNRWAEDRANVTAVCGMLGERALRYSNGNVSIGLDAAMKAAADVERYCQLHEDRRSRKNGRASSDASTARIAGYWCTWDPEP